MGVCGMCLGGLTLLTLVSDGSEQACGLCVTSFIVAMLR